MNKHKIKLTKKQKKIFKYEMNNILRYEILYYIDLPIYYPLNSNNYIPGHCFNCLKEIKIINSHSISRNWVAKKFTIYTLYHDFSNFPEGDYSNLDIISIFDKNNKQIQNNQFSNNITKYLPVKYHAHINQNIFIKHNDIFKYFIFSTYKNYCSICDQNLFQDIDNIKDVENFTQQKNIYTLVRRFNEFFNYHIRNYHYTLEDYVKKINIHNNYLSNYKKEIPNNKQKIENIIQQLIQHKEKKYIHGIFSLIKNKKIFNKIYQMDNLDLLYDIIIKLLTNVQLSTQNYNSIDLNKIIKKNETELEGYTQQLKKSLLYTEENIELLYSYNKEHIVLYKYDIHKTNNLFGFSYFNLNNIYTKLNMDRKDCDIGYCFLTPVMNNKQQFIIYGQREMKDKIEEIIDYIFFILNNKFNKKELYHSFFCFLLLHDSYKMNLFALKKDDLNRQINFINQQWDTKTEIKKQDIIKIIKHFRDKPII